MILETNGVSFELVVGACCVVKISNSLASGSQGTNVTMNINSTGAKKFQTYGKTFNSGNSSVGYGNAHLAHNTPPLFVYDGSVYMVASTVTYGDYQD